MYTYRHGSLENSLYYDQLWSSYISESHALKLVKINTQLFTNMMAENGYQMPTSSVEHLLQLPNVVISVFNIVTTSSPEMYLTIMCYICTTVTIEVDTHAAGSKAPMTIGKILARGNHTSTESSPVACTGLPQGLCLHVHYH